MAPVIYWTRCWVALVSFTLVNLWIDLDAIVNWLSGKDFPSHDEAWHTMHGALLTAFVIGLMVVWSWRWVLGAFFGGVSHIYLDALVHPEMQPFVDTEPGNPLYSGLMEPLSLALLPFTLWLIVLIVSGILDYVRKRRAEHEEQKTPKSS